MKRLFGLILIALGMLLVAVIAVNLTIYLETKPYRYAALTDVPSADAILIPGAAIYKGRTLSPVFQERADLAVALYNAHKAPKILVSGDNSTVSHNEADAGRTYLLQEGIPDQDIFLDHAGFDTYSTMYRARAVFGARTLIIATQSFHLPRAVFIARTLGIDAVGVSADTALEPLHNYVRELFANEKAVLDLMFRRMPKYLGPPIPLTGDGRDNP